MFTLNPALSTFNNDLVPANIKGKPIDLEYFVDLPSREDACECFKRAAKRMLNPPIWHELAGWPSAEFRLAGENGTDLHRLALEGDFIRINIPGPGPLAGEGYDWVKVEKLEDHHNPEGMREWIGMKVRPCSNPVHTDLETAHFFQSDATSSYIIQRLGSKVTVFYHGRNEVPNTSTENMVDGVRNALVAAGAIVSLSEAQWSALSRGFLNKEL